MTTLGHGNGDATLRFGGIEIEPAERVLRIDGRPAALGGRAFDLLVALAERRDRVVTRQELLDLVWPGLVVEEHNLSAQISSLRKVVGASAVATVPGRGYRFVAPAAAADDGVAASAAARRGNLPEQRTRFLGRATALTDLAQWLARSRLLTLTGIGGSGKTRLALQLARQCHREFADGAWFVDLAPLHQPERVVGACAAALGVDLAGAADPAERLAEIVAGRELLIVLDNCEQVRAGAAALVDALLRRPGSSRIVATSREPLALPGEQLYPVGSLSLPASAALADVLAADATAVFVDRARLAVPEFEVEPDNAAAVAEICRRLDGIPLALELAPARVTVLPLAEIAARLHERFRLLDGTPAVAMRRQTLLATMQWSDAQLEPAQRRALRMASVFAGGFTLEAATAVVACADDYETLNLLSALHEQSLLRVERADAADAGPRYRMLETVREYALQRLEESGEAAAASRAHARWMLALAEAAAPHLRGPQQPRWMQRLHREQENLVAAIGWCSGGAAADAAAWGLQLVAATSRYWLFHDVPLGCRLAEAALAGDSAAADGGDRFETLAALAGMHMHRGQAEAALERARDALAMAERLGSPERQALAQSVLGSSLTVAGRHAEALVHHEQAARLAERIGHGELLARSSNNVAEIRRAGGDLAATEQGYLKALRLCRAAGNLLMTAIVLHNLVRLYLVAGRLDAARDHAIQSERLLHDIGEDVLRFELLKVAAGLAACRGEHALAVRWWGAGQSRYTAAGYRDPEIDQRLTAQLLGQSRRALGEVAFEAAEHSGRALDLASALRDVRAWLGSDPA